jgi:hypothetical protein
MSDPSLDIIQTSDTTDLAEGKRTFVFLLGTAVKPAALRIEVLGKYLNIVGPGNKPLVTLNPEEDPRGIEATVENGVLTVQVPFRPEYLSTRKSIVPKIA